ncbi:penicillin acylase family protein [bacterium]|nr:penicillin acylase family protein [bacterium]
MRYFKTSFFAGLAVVIALAGYLYWTARNQGRAVVDWAVETQPVKVTFDEDGIPTLEGTTWENLIEAQGFVVASERMWQMDLMRRSGAGRLSEWFGNRPRAVQWDTRRRQEDWMGVADAAVGTLPVHEKRVCDLFAQGVNRFIEKHPGEWGVEYRLLGEQPEPWKCQDTLLILLSMIEDLTSAKDDEVLATIWQKSLTPDWSAFLFTQDHPWNVPMFGKPLPGVKLPRKAFTKTAIGSKEALEPVTGDEFFPGSNAWVYRGKQGTFVANDPHLGYSVPQLWYAVRFKQGPGSWAVGASIPGVPGIVLGRNAEIGWGFTNAKEDIDDLLEERISEDGKSYVARLKESKPQWAKIEEKPYTIVVRAADPIQGVARFTHRGPLIQESKLGEGWYTHQWLAYKPGMVRLPALAIMTARNWQDFNAAADAFCLPSQAAMFADRQGGIGVRLSGRSVERRVSGLTVQPAVSGEWVRIQGPQKRHRLYLAPGASGFIATANQRLWTEGFGEHWSSDLRSERLRTVLHNDNLSREDMEKLQLDTHSRYFKHFASWLSRAGSPATAEEKALAQSWASWNGDIARSDKVFSQLFYARGLLGSLLLGRVRQHFHLPAPDKLKYEWKIRSGWEVAVLDQPKEAFAIFGLDEAEVAHWLLQRVAVKAPSLGNYAIANRWKAQHPFVGAVPLLGRFFKVEEWPQKGFEGVVRVERPMSGATLRHVWDMESPSGGTWVFPVGQSGHVLSPEFKSFQEPWHLDQRRPVWR